MFYNLRDEYARKYLLGTRPEAESLLVEIDTNVQDRTNHLVTGETKIHDLIRSLVYSKSCDIALSRRSMFYGQSTPTDITREDIELSILTMPCDCPINYPCCENIVNGDINYVVAFTYDMELLKKQNISTIYDVKDKFQEDVAVSTLEVALRNDYPSAIGYKSNLYRQKFDIWKKSASEIAIPLADIYRANREGHT